MAFEAAELLTSLSSFGAYNYVVYMLKSTYIQRSNKLKDNEPTENAEEKRRRRRQRWRLAIAEYKSRRAIMNSQKKRRHFMVPHFLAC